MIMHRMLITGSQGVLGSTLKEHFVRQRYEILATNKENMDVRNSELVNDTISNFRPDTVFHLAAITDLELCEEQPDLAIDVNTYGTKNIVDACNAVGCKIVYVSTGAVFDGTKKEAYKETDKPNSRSVYGKTKYLGEQIIIERSRDYLIVRGGWLFGGFEKDKKFVSKILRLLMGGSKEICAIDDTRGSPTFAEDFVRNLELLILSEMRGIYHVTNQGFATRYDIAEKIIKATGINNVELKLVSSDYFKQKYSVLRIANETLDITKVLKMDGQFSVRPWEEAITEYVCRYIRVMKHARK